MKLSVVIITLNAADTIECCINSVRHIADEIVVVDGYSTDLTNLLALNAGAKVVQHKFTDFVAQRNFAVMVAMNDWVLSIDADEVLSKELAISIKVALATTEFDCYELMRLNNYCGRWMRFSPLHVRDQLRLFNRTNGIWWGGLIDEYWRPFQSHLPIGKLEGPMYHYPVSNWSNYRLRVIRRSDLVARVNFHSGRNYNLLSLILIPALCFLKNYVFRLGFLDLQEGYRAAKMYAFQKYLIIKGTRSYLSRAELPENTVFSKN